MASLDKDGNTVEVFPVHEDCLVIRQGRVRRERRLICFRYFKNGIEVNLAGVPCQPPRIHTFKRGELLA